MQRRFLVSSSDAKKSGVSSIQAKNGRGHLTFMNGIVRGRVVRSKSVASIFQSAAVHVRYRFST